MDTMERGTEIGEARVSANLLECELREWPWFVRADVEVMAGSVRIIAFVSVPVPDPGNVWCRLGPFVVLRRHA